MQLSELSTEQEEAYKQLKEWIFGGHTLNISNMPADERYDLLGVQAGSYNQTLLYAAAWSGSPKMITALLRGLDPDRRFERVKIEDRYGQTPLDVAAESGLPHRIAVMLKDLDMTQCNALILGDVEKGIKGVVSKLVECGHTDKISTLIGGIKGISNLTQEDKNALVGGILNKLPDDMEVPGNITMGTLRQAFGAVHNAPGEQDPAATATAAVVSPPAAGQGNGATLAPR